MKKIKAIIIDDEEYNCRNLQELLGKYCPELEIAGSANSVSQGEKLIQQLKPALVFLDIQMPGGSGFDLLDQLKPIPFEVIFVTAYDQYAIRAIRLCAIDYLLKPIDILDLQSAVNRAVEKIMGKKPNIALANMLENTLSNNKDEKIALPSSERVLFVKLSEIVRCLGENNYTTVFLQNGESVLVSKTLKEYEELLTPSGFLRVHQSHLINLRHIRSYEKQDGGYLKMADGASISISRQRKQQVLKLLKTSTKL